MNIVIDMPSTFSQLMYAGAGVKDLSNAKLQLLFDHYKTKDIVSILSKNYLGTYSTEEHFLARFVGFMRSALPDNRIPIDCDMLSLSEYRARLAYELLHARDAKYIVVSSSINHYYFGPNALSLSDLRNVDISVNAALAAYRDSK